MGRSDETFYGDGLTYQQDVHGNGNQKSKKRSSRKFVNCKFPKREQFEENSSGRNQMKLPVEHFSKFGCIP